MRGFKRPKKQQVMHSVGALFMLLVLLVLVTISAIKMGMKTQKVKEAKERQQEELTELLEQEEQLQADVSYFSSERGLEEEIRERFPVVKEGEELILIIDQEQELEPEEVVKKSFWKRIFGGRN